MPYIKNLYKKPKYSETSKLPAVEFSFYKTVAGKDKAYE